MSVTQQMQSMFKKCKYKQTKTLEYIKKIQKSFLNAPLSMQQAIDISLSKKSIIQQRSFKCMKHL